MIADEYLGREDDLHDDELVYPEYFEGKDPNTDTRTWTRKELEAASKAARYKLIERVVQAYESARTTTDAQTQRNR